MAERVVFLDACVLYPPLVRDILLGVARAGLFAPRWSPRVLGEWHVTTARKQGTGAGEQVAALVAEFAADFPAAEVAPDAETEAAIALPDPGDAHVLAAAIAAGAQTLLTFNLRDFPARTLAAHGITARSPDGFLWELLGDAPAAVETAISTAAANAGIRGEEDIRRALKKAGLWRLARAWAALPRD